MIAVYYKSGQAQWKYELEDEEHQYVIKSILEDNPDVAELFDDSLEVLRDLASMSDDELDEDDQVDQTIAVSFLWHYFNNITQGEERITGDLVVVEDEDGTGVTILPVSALEDVDGSASSM